MERQAIDELFERNADMRLLELRHASAGVATPAIKHTNANTSFGAESKLTKREELELDHVPRLRVAIAGAPQAGLIPGAVVGIAIDVFNDGNAPAPESKLFLALPHECEYRGGTLRLDGREPMSGEQLFAGGLPMPRLPGETSAKVTLQVVVLPGVGALYLQPRLQTDGVPVVGTPGISLKRASASAKVSEPERPFYELEAAEAEAEALPEASQPILPPAPEPPPPAPPAPAPKAKAAPAAPNGAPETPWPTQRRDPTPAPAPKAKKAPAKLEAPVEPLPSVAALTTPADEVMVRYRSIGAPDIARLERLFAPATPGLVAHYLAISSIACCETTDGRDAGRSAAFLRGDVEALTKALVAVRMGKPPAYRIDQNALDALGLEWEPAPAKAGLKSGAVRLRRDIRRSEFNAITGLLQRSERDATVRLRIALLALVGATLEGATSELAERCMAALTSYRSALLAWLVPLCVASNANAAFTVPAPPEAVDAAARRAIAALKEAVPA